MRTHAPVTTTALCLLALLTPAQLQAQGTGFWQSIVIDGAKYGQFASQVILPSGHSAICHFEKASGNLLYTWFDGEAWQTTIVDSSLGEGRYCSMALLPSGYPAIAYCDYVLNDLKYAWFDGTYWHRTTVDKEGWVGDYASLVILPDGSPAISYRGAGLKYARLTELGWQTTVVDPDPYAGWCTSIAVLPTGQPAISYYWDYYFGNKELCYAWLDEEGWHIDIVASSSYAQCLSTSLAISPTGRPTIAYSTLQDGVKYTWDGGKTWYSQMVSADGRYASLKFLPSGSPRVSFLDRNTDQLMYAWPEDKRAWATQVVDTVVEDEGIGPERISSLAIDSHGEPRIAYLDIANDSLKFAWREDGVWLNTLVAEGQDDVGKYSSLTYGTGTASHPWPAIAYQDETNHSLKYARCRSGAWETMTVDRVPAVGISLATLPGGQAIISYYDSSTGDLKYAEFTSGSWHVDTLAKDVGGDEAFTSIALLPSGQPAISYYVTYPLYDVRYTWFDGSTWRDVTVDKSLVGPCSSLTILPSGQPAISYRSYHDDGNYLTYAEFDGFSWTKTLIDRVTDGGWASPAREDSLTVLPNGMPAIAYYQQVDSVLKYAWFDGREWQTTVVDDTLQAGDHCSLTVLACGAPAISYHLNSDYHLKYAWLENSEWYTSTVDTAQSPGWYTSVLGSPMRQAAISHYRWIPAALIYAVELSLGDLNCDERVDLADVEPFVLALTDAAMYRLQYPDCHLELADCNRDGDLDWEDVAAFMELLGL